MLYEEKVGRTLRKSDKGVFTAKGYLSFASDTWTETYDGLHLPEHPDIHEGLISLRLSSWSEIKKSIMVEAYREKGNHLTEI